jgi:hypothetical protein
MQHVLQKYTLYTCHKSAQSGPPVMCFHLVTQLGNPNNLNCCQLHHVVGHSAFACFEFIERPKYVTMVGRIKHQILVLNIISKHW